MDYLTTENLLLLLLVVYGLCQIYNVIMQAIKNHRDAKRLASEPTSSLEETVAAYGKYLSNDQRRLEEHDREIKELKDGQRYLCQGVQALLEHGIHDGNATDMEVAAKDIAAWLRAR